MFIWKPRNISGASVDIIFVNFILQNATPDETKRNERSFSGKHLNKYLQMK